MSEVVPFTRESGFSGLHLEQGPRGHIHTPWLTFDWMREGLSGPADIRSQYHRIIELSKRAFAQAIGMSEESAIHHGHLIVTQREDKSDIHNPYWWRISTACPWKMPAPKLPPKPVLPENQVAIDI